MSKKEELKEEVLELLETYNTLAPEARQHDHKIGASQYMRCTSRHRFWLYVILLIAVLAMWVTAFFAYGHGENVDPKTITMAGRILMSTLLAGIVALAGIVFFIWGVSSGAKILPLNDEKALKVLRDGMDRVNWVYDTLNAERVKRTPWPEKIRIMLDLVDGEKLGQYWIHEDVSDYGNHRFSVAVKFFNASKTQSFEINSTGYELLEEAVAKQWNLKHCNDDVPAVLIKFRAKMQALQELEK